MTGHRRPGHALPLGQAGWRLWREGALRSAGFAATGLSAICDHDLASAADEAGGRDAGDPRLRDAYRSTVTRLTVAVAGIAADPAFREAVAWQNPALIGTCLDKLVAGEPRNSHGRLHESAVARYLQRYLLKNETIGFFGPVGWAELSTAVAGLSVRPGAGLLAARTTHFEMWAIDELARALASRPELADWLVPRRPLAVTVQGDVLRRPLRSALRLSDAEIAMLARCDGCHTVREVTSASEATPGPGVISDPEKTAGPRAMAGRHAPDPPGQATDDARGTLDRLVRLGAVHVGLDGPVDSWPERALRRKLEAIGEEPPRRSALADLDALTRARDAAGAARTAEELVRRTEELAEVFGKLTGSRPTRRPGQAYAGRTLLYSDARRDVAVVVGRVVLEALAAPLSLLLDSARWLVARVGQEYRALLGARYDEEAARSGSPDVPLAVLIARAALDLTGSGHWLPPAVQAAVGEFQRRWQLVLGRPAGSRRHDVSSAALAGAVRRQFGGASVPWSAAIHHSPDIMIAAASPEAVARGDFLLVLGELHVGVNSLDNRFFVQHHDDARRLLAAVEADHGDQRIYAAPPKSSPFVSSRAWPPVALLSDRYTYWTWSGEPCSIDPPGPVLPGAGLMVGRSGGGPGGPAELVVRSPDTGVEFDLLEVMGEILTATVISSFRPLAAAPHNPRVTIDRLVVCRESWTFGAADVAWAFAKDELARYAGARSWRARHGLPERVFVTLPVERKPIAVDFTSLPLVSILAKEVRRTAAAGELAFTATEMLPDLGQLWLADQEGQRYVSELRLVAVDGQASAGTC